jgi:hypothetical protein
MAKSGWIDQDTRAIQVLWSIYSAWSHTIYSFQANIELPGNSLIKFAHLDMQNIFLYERESDGVATEGDPGLVNSHIGTTWDLVMHTIIFLHFVLYTIKILFELSLSISRVTNFLEIINLIFLLVVVLTKYIEVIVKGSRRISLYTTTQYEDFTDIAQVQDINSIFLTLCCFFFPFRVFQFLAYNTFFAPGSTIINTLCRTAPGMFWFFLCCFIIVLGWAQGLHISLSPMYPEFNTYANTLYTLLFNDLQLIEVYHDLDQPAVRHKQIIFMLSKMVFICFKYMMILVGLALLTNFYKQAMIFEKGHAVVDPEKEAFEG